jgi:hypothetical protein
MIQNLLFALGMFVDKYFFWNGFLEKTKNPMTAQNKILSKILKNNRDTTFELIKKSGGYFCYTTLY